MDAKDPSSAAGPPEADWTIDWTRREFIAAAAMLSGVVAGAQILEAAPPESPSVTRCSLTINGTAHELSIDPRVTLLDLLREQLHLTGTKKGCDHGQCGACTLIADGTRVLSCLSLAVTLDGAHITTIEGLAQGDRLHPMQQAFLEYDGFQCGFCTSGQICSAVAMLQEAHAGAPSLVTPDLAHTAAGTSVDLSDDEIRERMSGNICRCGAYPNIVAAIRAVHRGKSQ